MAADDVSLLGALREALSFRNARQRVIAENVANVNTPGFVPNDIAESQFERLLANGRTAGAGLRTTHARHYGAESGSASAYQAERSPDSETTINGNAVVIEEQMVRANENRMKFETALSLYQKSLNMIRLAARPPGQ